MEIKLASTPAEVEACYPVIAQLRPHLSKEAFVALIERMVTTNNYALAYLADDEIKTVAGVRIAEWLHSGKYMEIEDLISVEEQRSKGYGGKLFDWLCKLAAEQGCRQVRLVSGVQREDAHRFYIRKGMRYEAKYFSLNVDG